MLNQVVSTVAAEQTIAVLCQAAEVAVDLVIPEGKAGADRQVFDLINIVTAKTTGIHLLQCDDVIIAD